MPTLRIAVRKFDPFESAIRRQLADFARAAGLEARIELEPLELNDLHPISSARRLRIIRTSLPERAISTA